MITLKKPRSLVVKAAVITIAIFSLLCAGAAAYIRMTDAVPGLIGGEACCCPDC